jgi:hypothetical protein
MLNPKITLNKTVSSYFIARREEECKILISVLYNITYLKIKLKKTCCVPTYLRNL